MQQLHNSEISEKTFFLNICTSLFLLVQKINKNMSIHLSYFLEKRLIVKPLNSCESIVGCFLFPKCDFFPPILSLVIDTYDVFIFKLLNPDRRRLLPHNFYINLNELNETKFKTKEIIKSFQHTDDGDKMWLLRK